MLPLFRPLRLLVGIWFQVYFTALAGLLFTFPSRYLFTIGLEKYLDLPVSTGGFPQAIRVLGYLRIGTKKIFHFRLRGYHPLGPSFPARWANERFFNSSAINGTSLPCNPAPHTESPTLTLVILCMARFSLLRVRSPLLTECMFVYFPPGTEMFYFPGYAPRCYIGVIMVHIMGFSHSDIFGSKVARHLPEAYRRHAASFIAFSSQGIHHTPFKIPIRNFKNRYRPLGSLQLRVFQGV